jgi:hypothetical protein
MIKISTEKIGKRYVVEEFIETRNAIETAIDFSKAKGRYEPLTKKYIPNIIKYPNK